MVTEMLFSNMTNDHNVIQRNLMKEEVYILDASYST